MADKRPSEFVGPQVRVLRKRRDWLQEDLAKRLEELGFSGWRQSKVAKIESGQAKRLTLDEVFELAVALDVTPLYLFTPDRGRDEQGEAIGVQLGPKISRSIPHVREWVRGQLPLFDPTEEPAAARFYLAGSVPIEEWSGEEFTEWTQIVRTVHEEKERMRGTMEVGGGERQAVFDPLKVPTVEVEPPKRKAGKGQKR